MNCRELGRQKEPITTRMCSRMQAAHSRCSVNVDAPLPESTSAVLLQWHLLQEGTFLTLLFNHQRARHGRHAPAGGNQHRIEPIPLSEVNFPVGVTHEGSHKHMAIIRTLGAESPRKENEMRFRDGGPGATLF